MTIAQITALLSLLLAFGVPAPTIHRVELILQAQKAPTAIIRPMDEQKAPEPVVVTPVEETPAPAEEKKSGYDGMNVPNAPYGTHN